MNVAWKPQTTKIKCELKWKSNFGGYGHVFSHVFEGAKCTRTGATGGEKSNIETRETLCNT